MKQSVALGDDSLSHQETNFEKKVILGLLPLLDCEPIQSEVSGLINLRGLERMTETPHDPTLPPASVILPTLKYFINSSFTHLAIL